MAKVKCPRCFYVNPEGQEQCVKCNTKLPRIKIEAKAPPPPQRPQEEAIQFRRGQVIARRYTVLNLIGRGGMGCIYKVHDNALGEDVALKTLLPQFGKDKVVVSRFFNEARIARKMAHSNIVRVHDIGYAENVLYISMEYLQGKSLRGILESLAPGQRLPLNQTLRVFDELCAALEYAHQFTVHRDIKPENVMIGFDGSVKLMDFGISKLMANTRLTGASVVMGTPFYMSPEQVRDSREVDARADIYSVGVMLYEVLTGNMPTGVPRPASQVMSDLPPELDAIVARCVEPDPKDRYQSATHVREVLRPILELVSGTSDSRQETTKRRRKTHTPGRARRIAGVALAVGLIMSMSAGVFTLERRRHRIMHEWESRSVQNEGVPEFARLAEIVMRARECVAAERKTPSKAPSAHRQERDPVEHVRAGHREALLKEAEDQWNAARLEAQEGREDATALAREALWRYVAAFAFYRRPEMVYIPAGSVNIEGNDMPLPPYFIDETEVTIGEYEDFHLKVPGQWRFPKEIEPYAKEYANLPMTRVAWFDAAAYAAYHGKQLPTEAQWARAAHGYPEGAPDEFPWGKEWKAGACNARGNGRYSGPAAVCSFEKDRTRSGCWDMAGNVTEWTRTPKPDPAAGAGKLERDFGVAMLIRGGHYDTEQFPLHMSETQLYEFSKADYLGFRCVLEIPTDPAAAEALLARLEKS